MTIFVVLLAVLGCGSMLLGLRTFLNLQVQNQELRQSFLIRDWLEKLPGQPVREEITKELQTYRAGLPSPDRQVLLSDVIQSYTANNQRLLKKRIDIFTASERKFVTQLEPVITQLEKMTLYYGALTFVLTLTVLLMLRSFLVRTLFDHIEGITKKMVDFLNGKYSYKFEVPPQNEIGDLQSSFNAMAQRVLQNMEELKALDNAKSEFLSIASHELRTPMTSIKGSLGLLNSGVMGDIPKDAQSLLTIAEYETDRLIRLINDILDMAKIEAGKLPLKLNWENLNHLLEDTKRGLTGLAETAGVSLNLSLPTDVEVHVDKDRIQQVITNLASNAIKYSPKGKTVTIGFEIEQESHHIRIVVKDNGRGISPDDQKRIFEKFRQATSSDNPLVKGTGLGLAIAKALVEEHNGSIGVESSPGKGSTFYFTLPQWRLKPRSEVDDSNETDENEKQFGVAA
jgi:signal transduction histidine kinase